MLKVSLRRVLPVYLITFMAGISYALDSDYVVATAPNEIKIMSYNAENLFDAVHDAGKNDYEYLPKNHSMKKNCPQNGRGITASGPSNDHKPPVRNVCLDTDWTAAKVKMKLKQIKKVIDAAGSPPDILTFCEVENKRVIALLAAELGYDGYYVTTSPDARGIDNAVLYRREKLTPIGFKEKELVRAFGATRNLSVAHFRLKKAMGVDGVIAVYPNHWPSQANPTRARLIAAEQMNRFIEDNKALYKGENYYTIATGDFNTLANESPNPLSDVLASSQENFLDAKVLSNASRNPAKNRMPRGTYYYAAKKQWNELDHIYVAANLFDKQGLEIEPTTFRIHAPSFATKKNDANEDVPFRYNHMTTNPAWLGYSDHFALSVNLKVVN